MSDILGKLGGLFKGGNLGTTLSGGAAGAGEVGNLLAGLARSKALGNVENQQKYIENLGPAGITKLAAGATQPIDQALRESVVNGVQGDLAQRGLAQAPGIFAATESQALAPFAQQNFDRALQATLTSLGLPLEYANTIKTMLPGTTSMTPALTLFLQQLAKRNAGGASQTGLAMGTPFPSMPSPYPQPGAPNIDFGGGAGVPDTGSQLDISQLVAP